MCVCGGEVYMDIKYCLCCVWNGAWGELYSYYLFTNSMELLSSTGKVPAECALYM